MPKAAKYDQRIEFIEVFVGALKRHMYTDQRKGQAFWNAAHEVLGERIEHLRDTPADPYHDDKNLDLFLNAIINVVFDHDLAQGPFRGELE